MPHETTKAFHAVENRVGDLMTLSDLMAHTITWSDEVPRLESHPNAVGDLHLSERRYVAFETKRKVDQLNDALDALKFYAFPFLNPLKKSNS